MDKKRSQKITQNARSKKEKPFPQYLIILRIFKFRVSTIYTFGKRLGRPSAANISIHILHTLCTGYFCVSENPVHLGTRTVNITS